MKNAVFHCNITHELHAPLSLILGPLEDLLSDACISQTLHLQKISIIHDSAASAESDKPHTGIPADRDQNRKLSVAKEIWDN